VLAPREYHGRRRDGSIATLEISSRSIHYQGQPATLALGRDTTQRNRSQAEIVHADRMSTLGTLATSIAHEVNNPLTYVIAHLRRLGALMKEVVPDAAGRREVEKLVGEALDGSERVARIVRDLLRFAHPGQAENQALSIFEVLDSVLNLVQPAAFGRGRIVRLPAEDIPAVQGDPSRLVQVFLNLVLNAVQAFDSAEPERNEVTIGVAQKGDFVEVTIADNGPGIAMKDVGRVFEPFFTTKPPGTGVGLGLTIARSIVESFGGDLALSSMPGEGTRVVVRLRRWTRPAGRR
jgi:C4-dicarboxylate-specific signal transduction histidine kinase